MDATLITALLAQQLPTDEVGLRQALDARVPGWVLYRLTPAAAKRWKCRYRVMIEAGYYDGMTVPEAYARAVLAHAPAAPEA